MWREKEKSRKGGVKRMDGSWRDLSKKDCCLKGVTGYVR